VNALKAVVFSRDRAMQLDAFLQSVELYIPSLFDELVVIYRATDESFRAGYERLREDRPEATWVAETSFRDDLLALRGDERLLVFHTDDDVYFRPVGEFELGEDEVCFSLRLGLNTTYSYPLDTDEALREARVFGDRVSWSWRLQDLGSYRYPLSVNGHVFRAAEAHVWLARTDYSNPNELEAALQELSSQVRPQMASFTHSAAVSIPANVVNETYANRHGSMHDVHELNERFLAGERIDVAAMSFDRIDACHVEVPFVFRRASLPRDLSMPGQRDTA
jgi:hypothetical protein